MFRRLLLPLLLLAPCSAEAKMLPAESVVCTKLSSIREVARADESPDGETLKPRRDCFTVRYPVPSEKLECAGRTCKVRLVLTGGKPYTGYTLRRYHP